MSEKAADSHPVPIHAERIAHQAEEVERNAGNILVAISTKDAEAADASGLKFARDGVTILIPQPSDDPNDPLNWSSFKKLSILLLVACAAFAGDFGACAGIPVVVVQGEEWGISPVAVTYASNLAAIMCGVSGLIWMPLLNSWGRMPVLFWSTILGVFFTLGATLSKDFTTYYAMRGLQSLTQSTGQTIGLAFVQDMFFFHEHARKIGIWYIFFVSAPFWSPLLGNFMVAGLGTWQPIFWLTFAWAVMLSVMLIVYGDETYYNRSSSVQRQPVRGPGIDNRLKRVVGLWQAKNHAGYFPGFLRSTIRMGEVFLKPVIPLCMLFYSAMFMWSIGINVTSTILLQTPRSQGGYGMGPTGVGLVYLSPIVAIFIGEAFGHYFNDFVANLYIRRHQGMFVPEVRLYTTYVGTFFMIPGLVLLGQTCEYKLHWVGIIFGFGMFQFGVMLVSVATVAYALDCYPSASGEVSALINFARVAAGFSVGYYQMEWGLRQGWDVSFGLQAVVVAFAFGLVVLTQIFGARLRLWGGVVRPLGVSSEA